MENEAVPEERPELVYTDHMESLSSSALPHARVQEKQEGSGPYTKQLRIEQDFSPNCAGTSYKCVCVISEL